MNENYLISIRGRQQYDDESGSIDIDTVGSYTTKNGVRYICYREYDQDNPNHSYLTTLKVDTETGDVTMIHSGGATRLFLQKGQRNVCRYDTGVGVLMLGVFTTAIRDKLDDNGGELTLEYTLDINASVSSRNSIHVTVKEAPQAELKQ